MTTWQIVVVGTDLAARILAGALVGAAALVALTHWAVRGGHLQAFGPWARGVRRLSDPLLRPIEQRLVRAGHSPQQATWWLLGLALGVGLLFLALVRWLLGIVVRFATLPDQTPGVIVRILLGTAIDLLIVALLVRVVGSWIGVGRYTRWMRPMYAVTDWLVEPIRRHLPPLGMFDLSPLVAYFGLLLLRSLL